MNNLAINKSNILFAEKQRFNQTWLWVILCLVNGLFVFAFVKQIIFKQVFGDKPMSDGSLVLSMVLVLLLSFGFIRVQMETRITRDGIYVRFFPFQFSFSYYAWTNLTKCYVREYSPLGEYGGWVLKGVGKNRSISVYGSKGIQLETLDGHRMLIGTARAEEVHAILMKLGQLVE